MSECSASGRRAHAGPADPPRPWSAPVPDGPLDAVVDLPGAKSLTARALLLAAVVLAARLLAWVSARATVLTNAADEGAAALARSRDVLLDAFSGERRRIER